MNIKTTIFLISILSLMNLSFTINIAQLNTQQSLNSTATNVINETEVKLPTLEECKSYPYQKGCPGEQAGECSSIWSKYNENTTDEEFAALEKEQDDCIRKWCENKENLWVCQDLKINPDCFNSDHEAKGCPSEEPECDSENNKRECIEKFCQERSKVANTYCRNVYMGLELDIFSDISHETDKGEVIDGTRVVFCPPYDEGFPFNVPECSKFFCKKIESLVSSDNNKEWLNEQIKQCDEKCDEECKKSKRNATETTNAPSQSFLKKN
jgi:hypothetical protein